MSKKSISKMLFSNQERVELALVQDIIRDAEIAQGNLKALINVAARRGRAVK